MKFEITSAELNKVNHWLYSTVYPAEIAFQKKKIKKRDPARAYAEEMWEEGYPYTGASGGGLSYVFTPTSIGVQLLAKYKALGPEAVLDLTDYGSW